MWPFGPLAVGRPSPGSAMTGSYSLSVLSSTYCLAKPTHDYSAGIVAISEKDFNSAATLLVRGHAPFMECE